MADPASCWFGLFNVPISGLVCHAVRMKAHTSFQSMRCLCAGTALLGLLLAGCATKKTDWNSRVGSYTYDQAVIDLGPPDKKAKLSDGKTVAEWITHRSGGGGLSIGVGGGSYGRHGGMGVGVSQSVGSGSSDRGLRLIFGTDGKLSSWSK